MVWKLNGPGSDSFESSILESLLGLYGASLDPSANVRDRGVALAGD